jgi:anti-sigma regulatory factor (Ser/Thr protein kinase)
MAQELTAIGLPEPVTVKIMQPVDVKRANASARGFARAAGFAPAECEEIALVVTELGSNLVKHAGGGEIELNSLVSGERKGIQIESEDSGPGIADVELAVTDGYSTTGSLGNGLGAVNRLMDELEVHPHPPTGVRILCRRWVRPATKGLAHRRLEFGAATRACRLLPENGDALVIRQWEGHALAGVIDGLGHGQFAQRASQAARYYIEQHFDQPLESLFRGVARTCRSTRGVVMALGRFDLARQVVTIASVGNVEVRLIGSPGRFNLIVRRGILGFNAPNPVVSEHPWTPSSLLIMHSDGLRAHWEWDGFRDLAKERPAAIARHLLNKLGNMQDDATVVVVGNASP